MHLDYNVSSGPFLSSELIIGPGPGPGPELDNYDGIKVDKHGWPEEAYEEIEYPVHKDDPKNKRRIVLIIAASIIASLLATLIATTIYRNFFSE